MVELLLIGVVVVFSLYGFYLRARRGDSFGKSMLWEFTSIADLRLDEPLRSDVDEKRDPPGLSRNQ